MMTVDTQALGEIVMRLLVAVAFGATVGLERGYHGRPAGFRTHALVCLASAALMLVPAFPTHWAQALPEAMHPAIDPTRLAQGIMTGIGFLGAGVIMKEGLSVRGLTTAASIWTTAGIGILAGIGWFLPALLTTVLTLGTLAGFRFIERRVRHENYAEFVVRFGASRALAEPELVAMVEKHGFSVADITHLFRRSADTLEHSMEYQMTLCSLDKAAVLRLSDSLRRHEDVAEFRISPSGN